MLSSLLQSLRQRVKVARAPKPLVPPENDMHLVRKTLRRRFPSMRQLSHIARILAPWERRLLRVSVIAFVVGLAWVVADAAQAYRVTVPAVGGKYMEAVVGAPALVNPLFASLNDVDMDITRLVFSGLMRYDDKERLVPDLAVSVTTTPDKKTYTFELRRGVVWHDGEPFTARDVAFTFATIQDAQVGSPLLVTFQGVTVEAVNDYTVRFTLKEAFAPFLSTLTIGIIPEHVWGDVPANQVRLHKRNLQPIGTGPFAFDKLSKDASGYIYEYQLKRFPEYYRQPSYIETFAFQFFSGYGDTGGAVEALREGHVDGMSFVPHEFKEKVARKHIVINNVQLPQYTALFFNSSRNAILKDGKIRAALEHAIDKNRLVREALKGEGKVIHGPILPGFPGYDEAVTTTPYSIDQANQLLDSVSDRIAADTYRSLRHDTLLEAWKKDHPEAVTTSTTETATSTDATAVVSTTDYLAQAEADIARELDQELYAAQTFYRQGKTDKKSTTPGPMYTLRLVTADTAEYRQAAELIAGFWQEIGVQTIVSFVSPKDMSRDVLKDRSYDVLLYGAMVGSDPDQYPFWHSSQVDFPGLNLSRYASRAVDALIEQARAATELAEQETIYKKFQTALMIDRPAIFLYTPTYRYVTTDRIMGVNVDRIYQPADRFANVTDWYIETDGRWQF